MKRLSLSILLLTLVFPLVTYARPSDSGVMGVAPTSDSQSTSNINLNKDSSLFDEGIADPDPPLPHNTTVLDGIPLMEGLQISKDPDLITVIPDDTPQPLVVVGIIDVDDVYNFYKRELPSLGWKASGPRDYMRDQTLLHINAQADGKLTTVTFTEIAAK